MPLVVGHMSMMTMIVWDGALENIVLVPLARVVVMIIVRVHHSKKKVN